MVKRKIINPVSANKKLEEPFARYLIFRNIKFVRQFKPFEKRKYKCDFYLPEYNTIIEIEGGQWSNGRHTRGKGFQLDIEKYNKLTLAGYKVYRLTTSHFQKTGMNEFACVGYAANLINEIVGLVDSTTGR